MAENKSKYDTPLNPEHLEIVKAGAEAIEEWRMENPNQTFHLKDADLRSSDLSHANLSYAYLMKAKLNDSDLKHADLRHADLTSADLRNADLRNADLSRSDLTFVDMQGADLSFIEKPCTLLLYSKIHFAKLQGANFRRSRLAGSDISHSDLRNTDLTDADLSFANLSWVSLYGSKLAGCNFGSTSMASVDLSETIGLEHVVHVRPSSIGIDTLFLSRGKLPEVFLRGCGVPADFIDFIPSLVGTGIEFYSSFISYSHKNEDFAIRLHSRMQQEKLRVWYAPEDMKGGRKTHHQIDEAIRVYDKLLLVLSEESMNSEWVKSELRWASREEKRTGKQKLFPVRLVDMKIIQEWKCFDADIGKNLAIEVREYHIPDFTNWKDQDSFESEFKKLLRDLKGDSPRKTAE